MPMVSLPRLNGCNRTHFCGAYFGNGFHEVRDADDERMVEGFRGYAEANGYPVALAEVRGVPWLLHL